MSSVAPLFLFIPNERFVVHPLLSNMKEDEVVSLIPEYKLNSEERKYVAKVINPLSC